MNELYPKCEACGQRKMPMELVMKEFALLTYARPKTATEGEYASMLMRDYERQKEADLWLHLHKEMEHLKLENQSLREKLESNYIS